MITADEQWRKLDAVGEDGVRQKLAQGAYGEQKIPLVNEWLGRKERQRNDARAQGQDSREDQSLKLSAEANSIAREGHTLARRSNIAAWSAVAISLLALAVAIVSVIIEARR